MWWFSSSSSRFRRTKYEDYFHCLDRNRSGYLDADDLRRFADHLQARLGWSAGDPRHAALVDAAQSYWRCLRDRMDEDQDGVVQLGEFVGCYDALADEIVGTGAIPPWAMVFVRALFQALDADGDGSISRLEYALYLEAIGSDADASAAFSRLDLDGNGVLDLQELETLYTQWLTDVEAGNPGNLLMTGRLPR